MQRVMRLRRRWRIRSKSFESTGQGPDCSTSVEPGCKSRAQLPPNKSQKSIPDKGLGLRVKGIQV